MTLFTKLDRAIAEHTEAAFGFLEDLVAAPSVVGTEQDALEVLAAELTALGLEVERIPFDPRPMDHPLAGAHQHLSDASDRFQVVGRTPGQGELTLLLNGHMDVVPAESPGLWTTPPFAPSRRNGRMYGRGTGDMKGGFAIGVLALRALREVSPELFATKRLGFIGVIEEECTGNGALQSALGGVLADEILLLEPTDNGIMVGGVGVLWVDIDVIGSSSHAHTAHLSANAIELGMRIVQALRDWGAELYNTEPDPELSEAEGPYNLNIGKVRSGDWTSTVPVIASFSLRLGFPRSWSPARAETEVREVVRAAAAADPDFPEQPRVRSSGLRAVGYSIARDHPMVKALSVAHLDAHGQNPEVFSLGSTTDARTYVNACDTPALCFGAVAHNIHGVDESVELQSIVDGARTLSRFLLARFDGAA